jgi:hypothetical protein
MYLVIDTLVENHVAGINSNILNTLGINKKEHKKVTEAIVAPKIKK